MSARAKQRSSNKSADADRGPDETTSDGRDVLSVMVSGERFAIPAHDAGEIIRVGVMTRVPLAPAWLLGLANLRGTVLPIVSLARLLGKPNADLSPSSRVIVIVKGPKLGLLVDAVSSLGRSHGETPIDLEALINGDFAELARRGGDGGRQALAPLVSSPTVAAKRDVSLLSFMLDTRAYAFHLGAVSEILRLPHDIVEGNHADPTIIGVMAYRGALLPLVSLPALLGLPVQTLDRDTARVVVIQSGGDLAGVVTDGVNAILHVAEETIDPVPPLLARGQHEARIEAICRRGTGASLIAVLSPAGLLGGESATRLLASAPKETAPMTNLNRHGGEAVEQFLIFTLGAEFYGLPIAAVDEVVRRPASLTPVPLAPPFLAGMMNLRGKALPVIDQHQRFAATSATSGGGGRVVIVSIDGLQAGLAVDAAPEVLSVAARDIQSAPDLLTGYARVFGRVVNDSRKERMILLVDPGTLLSAAERDLLTALPLDMQSSAQDR